MNRLRNDEILPIRAIKYERIGHNFMKYWLENDPKIYYRYVYTDIVIYNPTDESAILNTGGWQTNTTIKNMNQALQEIGFNKGVYIKRGEIQISNRQNPVFEDNIKVYKDEL